MGRLGKASVMHFGRDATNPACQAYGHVVREYPVTQVKAEVTCRACRNTHWFQDTIERDMT